LKEKLWDPQEGHVDGAISPHCGVKRHKVRYPSIFGLRPSLPALEKTNPLRLNTFQKLVSGPFHLLQLFLGISKEIHPHPTEIWLVMDGPLQKRQVALFENQKHISVTAGNRVPPGQGAQDPNFGNFRMQPG
jgi:hypothetical protein